jgi:hypothetical protein
VSKKRVELDFAVQPQPDNLTCGPTCLHAVYRYWGDSIGLSEVIAGNNPIPGGGTLAVLLGCHALRRGYDAELFTYNLQVFDPTWFQKGVDLADRLRKQLIHKRNAKLKLATHAYLEFLELGGRIRFREFGSALLREHLNNHTPILAGLSATYLYGCAREFNDRYDDVKGDPAGHFVVLCGYDRRRRLISVADPLQDNPRFRKRHYRVATDRVVAAILLGIVTYDANLLVIKPKA